MTECRRAWLPGAAWFLTVDLAERCGKRVLVEWIDALRTAFRSVRARYPFHPEAAVVLPDHLHCVWTLAPGDTDYSTRRRGIYPEDWGKDNVPGLVAGE